MFAVAHHHHRPPTFDILGRRLSNTLYSTSSPSQNYVTLQGRGQTPPAENNSDPFEMTHDDVYKLSDEEKSKMDFQYSSEPLLDSSVPFGSYELRVTLVWAPAGSQRNLSMTESDESGLKVKKLEEWAAADVVPDVIILGEFAVIFPSIFSTGNLAQIFTK